jgi:nitroreductase
MEFADIVMKRRAVRRFEEGGVEREVIERIARLAQRTPSAGFSQGQRLVGVTEPGRRREVARICGEAFYVEDFGPWISECAAQFIPCVSEAIYHRRYQEPDKLDDDGTEIDWPVPFWFVDIGATMQNIMLAAVNEGLGCGCAEAAGYDWDASSTPVASFGRRSTRSSHPFEAVAEAQRGGD